MTLVFVVLYWKARILAGLVMMLVETFVRAGRELRDFLEWERADRAARRT